MEQAVEQGGLAEGSEAGGEQPGAGGAGGARRLAGSEPRSRGIAGGIAQGGWNGHTQGEEGSTGRIIGKAVR